MDDNHHMKSGVAFARRIHRRAAIAAAAATAFTLWTVSSLGQSPVSSSYPVDPTAAAGMTSGLPNVNTGQQAQLVNARTEALAAQGDAVAASMARSADQQLEQQNTDRVLERAREEKAIKRAMADRARWERATSNNVQKVSANDMSSWNTSSGGVRVERNVPDPFITALIEEEKILAEQEAASAEREPGFGPFRGGGLNPFKKNQSAETRVPGLVEALMDSEPRPSSMDVPAADLAEDSGGGGPLGMIGRIRPPRFKIGREAPEADPVDASAAEPRFVQTSASPSSGSAPAAAPRPGTIPRISGAELVDGSAPVMTSQSPSAAPPQPQSVSFSEGLPGDTEEKPGLFSRLKSGGNDGDSSSGGGGLFSFGKKKPEPESPGIDASLFPSTSVSMEPTGGSLQGGYAASSVDSIPAGAPASTGSFALPGEEAPEARSGGGFSFPKPPSISVPKLGSGSSSGGGDVPTLTTVNSSGNSYYVVTQTAQFMVQGEDQLNSEIRALPAGSVVLMTKPGDNWAQVSVPGGASGIVQNKFLRPASAAEAGGQFAVSN